MAATPVLQAMNMVKPLELITPIHPAPYTQFLDPVVTAGSGSGNSQQVSETGEPFNQASTFEPLTHDIGKAGGWAGWRGPHGWLAQSSWLVGAVLVAGGQGPRGWWARSSWVVGSVLVAGGRGPCGWWAWSSCWCVLLINTPCQVAVFSTSFCL